MKINYIDPALKRKGGHHADWCARIVGSLGKTHVVRVYAHRGVEAGIRRLLAGTAEVIPHFHVNPYSKPNQAASARYRPNLVPETTLFLAAELRRLEAADLWLWPTLFAHQLSAMALAGPECPITACIHWAPEARTGGIDSNIWRHGGNLAKKFELCLKVGVTIPELAQPYSSLLGEEVAALPILVDALPDVALRQDLRRIGFFGQQRGSKGIAVLPELIRRLHGKGYELIVQDSGNKLRNQALPGVRYLGYVPDLGEEIGRCDLVVAPYVPEDYRTQGSGIVWEAIARGVPVAVTADTSPGRFIEGIGAGVTFTSLDPESICSAVAATAASYARLAEAAYRAAMDWPEHHGTSRFVAAMMAGNEVRPA